MIRNNLPIINDLLKCKDLICMYEFGSTVYKSNDFYSDIDFIMVMTCNKCGYIYKGLTLNEREWKCPQCGEYHDRDLNAAINILHEGERIIRLNS